MADKYMIVPQQGGLNKDCGRLVFKDFETDAIKEATRLAILHNEPFEIYELALLGASSLPQSKFIDYRPQPVVTTT